MAGEALSQGESSKGSPRSPRWAVTRFGQGWQKEPGQGGAAVGDLKDTSETARLLVVR